MFWVGFESSVQAQVKPSVIDWLNSVYLPVEGAPANDSVATERRLFMQARLANAPMDFDKWRSFPPTYYSVLKELADSLPTSFVSRRGTVAGDPHPENFGYIALSPPRFVLNDMDDVTIGASLDADLMRLYIGAQFVDPTLTADEFLKAYRSGLSNENTVAKPAFVTALAEDANDAGKRHALSKKVKTLVEAKTCSGEFELVSEQERNQIAEAVSTGTTCKTNLPLTVGETKTASILTGANQPRVILMCRRKKASGGSAGSDRFLVITEKGVAGSKNYEAFEYKELSPPAPRFEPMDNEKRRAIYVEAVKTAIGDDAAKEYYPKEFSDGILYQRRPAWKGNQAVKLGDVPPAELKSVLLYEAQTLGQMHRKSNPSPMGISNEEWTSTANKIKAAWKAKFEKS